MNNWSVNFETHTRDDLLKVCAVLARGISKDTATSNRVKIAIDGQLSSGKTAVVDGLSSALIDVLTPYKMPIHPLIEDYPCQAFDGVKKEFEIDDKPCLISLGRHEYVDVNGAFEEAMTGVYNTAYDRGIDFFTGRPMTQEANHIFIDLNYCENNIRSQQDWSRTWSINIMAPYLQTPLMSEALQNLRNFHAHRQARLSATLQEIPALESHTFG